MADAKKNNPPDVDSKMKELKVQFMAKIRKQSEDNVQTMHRLAKRLWDRNHWTPSDVQNTCRDAWDKIGLDLDTKIVPIVPVSEDRPVTDLIFGSGSFSTGEHQIKQFKMVEEYTKNPPVILQGLVTNKSATHQCNAANLSKQYNIPLAEVDFIDWYHQFYNPKETNPIAATRYWYMKDDPTRPPQTEIEKRFKIRQNEYHKAMGEKIASISKYPTDIASARGYSFQFCHSIFKSQLHKPQANDTHPADLTYVDPKTKAKLYPGWQSGAIELMMKDKQKTYRGSLIEVEYMNEVHQIDSLDEGALFAIGNGVTPEPEIPLNAKEIQEAMKIIDDYVFCTLEPTGLFLTWGITEKPLLVSFQDINGKIIQMKQRVIFVGNKMRSGVNCWGKDVKKDIKELEEFLCP